MSSAARLAQEDRGPEEDLGFLSSNPWSYTGNTFNRCALFYEAVFLKAFFLGRAGHRVLMCEPSAKELQFCQLATHENQRLFWLRWLSEAGKDRQDKDKGPVCGAEFLGLTSSTHLWPSCAS